MDKNYNSDISSTNITKEDLSLINKFTLKELSADEVFVFSVVLCDNEIDRDGERFDNNALLALKERFVGVTGIFDHTQSSKNQTARIFSTQVVSDSSKKTSYGGEYKYLKARAYMPKTEKNSDLISEIDAGIKKEVSVCCSVKSNTCSICGNDMRGEKCSHLKGASYSGKLCHCVLDEVADVYEWSFVAVPAQANAGVVKEKVTKSFNDFKKSFNSSDEITISRALSKQLGERLSSLEKEAQEGREYRRSLTKQTKKYACLVLNELEGETVSKMCDSLDINSLKKLCDSFMKKAAKIIPLQPQLEGKEENQTFNNNEFIF